jgi:hypothetical protein
MKRLALLGADDIARQLSVADAADPRHLKLVSVLSQ